MKNTAFKKPQVVKDCKTHFELSYNINETKEGETERTMYNFDFVKVVNLDYETIVSAIIRQKYSIDQEFALNNNYQTEGTSQEWEEYQSYRILAKQTAKSILGI